MLFLMLCTLRRPRPARLLTACLLLGGLVAPGLAAAAGPQAPRDAAAPGSAAAGTLLEADRGLALVIGSNGGSHPGWPRVPPLAAAEATAREVATELARTRPFGRGDVRLLLDPTRSEVLDAAEELMRRVEQSRARGGGPVLFILHYIGHGFGPDLVLRGGPLKGAELERLLAQVDADFTVAVLDRCRDERRMGVQAVASADLAPLTRTTQRAGVVLYSTEPNRPAYEIEGRVLFTSAWLEGLRRGPAFTLEEVWRHARRRTRSVADSYRLEQSPTADPPLRDRPRWGSVVLRVPGPRSAELELGPQVSGPVELVYSPAYSERLTKAPGRRQRWDIHPGTFHLLPAEGAQAPPSEETLPHVVGRGQRLVVERSQTSPPAPRPGEEQLRRSLGHMDPGLRSTLFGAGSTLGLGVTQRLTDRTQLLPHHSVGVTLQLDRGAWAAGLEAGYGFDRQTYQRWDMTLQAAVLRLHAERALYLGRWRLAGGVEVAASRLWQTFRPTADRTTWALQPGARCSLAVPLGRALAGGLVIAAGPALAPGVGATDEHGWGWWAAAGLALHARVP